MLSVKNPGNRFTISAQHATEIAVRAIIERLYTPKRSLKSNLALMKLDSTLMVTTMNAIVIHEWKLLYSPIAAWVMSLANIGVVITVTLRTSRLENTYQNPDFNAFELLSDINQTPFRIRYVSSESL